MAISEQELLALKIKQENGIKLTKEEKQILKDNSKEEKEKKSKMSFGERLLKGSASPYAQLMGDDDEDKYPIRDWIDTGNYLFNAQLCGNYKGGAPSGRIIQLAGESAVGKTFLMLEIIKHAQEMGYYAVLYDSEMANNDKEELKKRGIDTSRLLYVPVDTVENLKTSVLNILDEVGPNDKLIMGIDSIGNLSTAKELADSSEGSLTKDMTRPAQLKALFRTCTLRAGIKNVPIIAVNHVYANIGSFTGGTTIAGGGGPAYNASITINFTKAQEKGSDGKTSGAIITSNTVKSRTSKEKTKIKFSIDFESGLGRYSGLELFCIEEKLIQKVNKVAKTKDSPEIPGGWLLNIPTGYDIDSSFCVAPNIVKKLTDEFWEEFLKKYLGEYLSTKFKYQADTEGILPETEEEDD